MGSGNFGSEGVGLERGGEGVYPLGYLDAESVAALDDRAQRLDRMLLALMRALR